MRRFLIVCGAAMVLTGCSTTSFNAKACAAYESQLAVTDLALRTGQLTPAEASAELARLKALPERTACLGDAQ